MERVQRTCDLAARCSVCVWVGRVAVRDFSRQWHHRNTGEPGWAGLSSPQSLHRRVLRGLREPQALPWWGVTPSAGHAVRVLLFKHAWKHILSTCFLFQAVFPSTRWQYSTSLYSHVLCESLFCVCEQCANLCSWYRWCHKHARDAEVFVQTILAKTGVQFY